LGAAPERPQGKRRSGHELCRRSQTGCGSAGGKKSPQSKLKVPVERGRGLKKLGPVILQKKRRGKPGLLERTTKPGIKKRKKGTEGKLAWEMSHH